MVIKSVQVQIRGINFKCRLLKDADFEILHGNQADGSTGLLSKTIDFKASRLSMELVKHEIFHAYFYTSLTETALLEPLQVEECAAELFAYFGAEMIKTSDHVFKKFNRS